ncbi:hypothetical protein R3P38DRAFT_2440761, partial [Favolaschia claudopus]
DLSTIINLVESDLVRLALPHKATHDSEFEAFSVVPFCLDEKYLELTEDECSTISEMLKRSFGWNARTTGDCIVEIKERGPAICSLYPVLRDFNVKHPRNNVLRKWVLDIIEGAEKIY